MPTFRVTQRLPIILLFISLHLSIIYAADCNTTTDCSTCISSPGCGWCGATQTCMAGAATGPEGGLCLGSWDTTHCLACTSFGTCRTCNHNIGCTWCDVSTNPSTFVGGCRSIREANTSTCPIPINPCPCFEYNTCNECSQVPGCTFCDTGSCHSSTNCSSPVSCDCGNYPTCTSCFTDPHCGWIANSTSSAPFCTPLPTQSHLESCDAVCAKELGCMQCTAEKGCGWCPENQQCHSVDSPNICGNMLLTQCPKLCHLQTDCNLCIDEGLPCEWCPERRSCVDIRTSNCSVKTDSCASEVCPTLDTCDECLTTPGCGWCEHNGKCADIADNSCRLARNCSGYFKGGFSLGSFFGGMATMLGLYLLIGLCAYFYKKKNPPKHYQEMQ